MEARESHNVSFRPQLVVKSPCKCHFCRRGVKRIIRFEVKGLNGEGIFAICRQCRIDLMRAKPAKVPQRAVG